MVLFLLALLVGLTTFILILAVRDLSPLKAFYKAARKITGINFEPQPLPMDSPFSRPSTHIAGRHGLHRPVLLNLETYEGTGQGCHPDVLYIAEGFGAGRWRYWMALTPYPHARHRFENPSIYASYDGVNWVVPGTNPIVQPPSMEMDHLSDVDMIFTGGRLRLYYRESLYSSKPAEHRIHAVESDDGVHWTAPQRVLSSRTALLCSPSVVEHENGFSLWEVSDDVIWRRESPDGLVWGAAEVTAVIGLPLGQVPWHLDVYRQGGRLHVILNSGGVDGHRLNYGFSRDGGRSWEIQPYLIDRVYGFEWGQHYRATMIAHPERDGLFQLWYSARSREMVWSIAYMHLIAHGDTMSPVEVAPSATVPHLSPEPKAATDYAGALAEGTTSLREEKDALVSVIIPAFNARSTIREALESVRAQTYRNLDIVIVDDGSSDGTLDEIMGIPGIDPRVRIIRRENNGGIPSTRNIGIKASRGVYLSFLDADDLWHPDKIRLQLDRMNECGPQVAVVYSWCTYMDAEARIIPNRVFAGTFEGNVYAQLLMSNFVNNTWLVRRSCLDAVGYYRENLVTGNEDLQIYLDLAARFDFAVVPQFLTAYRLLPSSKSHDVWNMLAGHRSVLKLAREQHPSLPAWLFRWAEANQLWFLGFRCLRAKRCAEGVTLLLATIICDPGFILRPTVRRTLMRTIFRQWPGRAEVKSQEGPRRRFLDGGPPPHLKVPQVRSRIEEWRAKRVSSVSVRTASASEMTGQSAPIPETSPGLSHGEANHV
jgi:glycosyltransferase involved in cell wall biosynthesis